MRTYRGLRLGHRVHHPAPAYYVDRHEDETEHQGGSRGPHVDCEREEQMRPRLVVDD